jgi:putative ABC transport system permease protein
LTRQDLRTIAGLPTIALAVPVRRFPQESRRPGHAHSSIVVGTTPELADVLSLQLETGRFLSAQDVEERRNVVVLGAAVADALFAGQDPLGGTITLYRESYRVVGVLRDGDARDDLAAERNASVFVPLSTCHARFGERVVVQRRGVRSAEAVPLSEIYLTLHSPQDLAGTIESVRGLLEETHTRPDWAIRADQ